MVRIGVIAAGGKGIRFKHPEIQKCLIRVEGKPILEYTIDAFLQIGIEEIIVLSGFHREQVQEYVVRKAKECNVAEYFGGEEGQISAILKLQHVISEDFIYAGGDCIFPKEYLEGLIQTAATHPRTVSVMLASTIRDFAATHPQIVLFPGTCTVKEVHGLKFDLENAPTGMGIYYFRPPIFSFLSQVDRNPAYPTSEFLPYAQKAGETILASVGDYPWFCIHTPEDLAVWQKSAMYRFIHRPQ